MEFSLELWAAVVNAGIFLCLMAVPWTVGPFRVLVAILGLGGILCLLGFNLYLGVQAQDYALASDLMLLTLTKALFFFGASFAAEKIFRTFFRRSKEQNKGEEWQEEQTERAFDRNIRGLKDPNAKRRK